MKFVVFAHVGNAIDHYVVEAQSAEEAEQKTKLHGYVDAEAFEESYILKLANASKLHDNLPVLS